MEAQLKRFTHLMTEMTSVGIEMTKGEVNKKLLNSLPYNWNSNCTTIKRTKDMYKTSLSELISIINFYDMDDKQRALNHANSMGIPQESENGHFSSNSSILPRPANFTSYLRVLSTQDRGKLYFGLAKRCRE